MPSLNRRQVESLSLVARLLASENIRVQHSASAQTASFETKGRVLTLPVWKEMSGDLYDMLVAHEVAHALYTPKGDDWVKDLVNLVGAKNFNKFKGYVNIVEDARIERMMKDRYGGLRSVFARAYRDLTVKSPKLFALDKDINDLPLVDRVNIHYKVGFAVDVPFSAEEMPLVKRVAETKTWDEVVALAKELYDLSKKQQEEKQEEQQEEQDSSNGSQGEDSEGEETEADASNSDGQGEETSSDRGETVDQGENEDAGESNVGGEESDEADGEDAQDGKPQNGKQTESKEKSKADNGKTNADQNAQSNTESGNDEEAEAEADASVTDQAMDELSKENLVSDDYDRQRLTSTTVTIPTFDIQNGVVPFEEVISDLKIVAEKTKGYELYQQFLAKNKTAVAALVQEFMRRKAADESQRTRTADTGGIDPSRLWAYRVSEEIFGSYEIKREGKNHGLMFLLDWSGSMNAILRETIEQLSCLVQFCSAAGIPCEVYAFSNNNEVLKNGVWSKEAGQIVPDTVALLHILSASARPAQLKTAIAGLLGWTNKYSLGYGNGLGKNAKGQSLDGKYYLNGTPLNAALAAMNTMIPLFQKKTGVQIVNLCVLTDGDATDRVYYVSTGDGQTKGMQQGETGNGGYWNNNAYYRVSLHGKRAVVDFKGREDDLVRFLRQEHGVNVLGFRVGTTREISNNVKYGAQGMAASSTAANTGEFKKMQKVGLEAYIKEKSKFLRDSDWVSAEEWYGYTEWFGVSNLKTDEADYLGSVTSESTKAALAKALSAEIGKAKSSRPLMARIAQRVSVSAK